MTSEKLNTPIQDKSNWFKLLSLFFNIMFIFLQY